MSKRKWHDITPETGDPSDLPDGSETYLVTIKLDTRFVWFALADYEKEWWDSFPGIEARKLSNVVAWRELPKPYVPGKAKRKRRAWHDPQNGYDVPARDQDGERFEVWYQNANGRQWGWKYGKNICHGYNLYGEKVLKWRYPPEWEG